MRRLASILGLLLAATLLASCAAFDTHEVDVRTGGSVKLIGDDPGGDLLAYEARFRRWAADAARVKVGGLCASACTLVLAFLPADRICLTERARFGFHSARLAGSVQVASAAGRRGNPDAVTDLASMGLYLLYPDWLQRVIARQSHRWDRQGLLPPSDRLLVIEGKHFLPHGHPACT
jgi:hypothetical protein